MESARSRRLRKRPSYTRLLRETGRAHGPNKAEVSPHVGEVPPKHGHAVKRPYVWREADSSALSDDPFSLNRQY